MTPDLRARSERHEILSWTASWQANGVALYLVLSTDVYRVREALVHGRDLDDAAAQACRYLDLIRRNAGRQAA